MANKIHKKPGKAKSPHRRTFRNAVAPRPAPTAPPRRPPPVGDGAKDARATLGTLQTAAGAAGAALLCAYVAANDWLPPKMVTAVVTAVGASCALVSRSPAIRSVGGGVMSAAGAQLGLMTIDDYKNPRPAPAPKVAKKPANAEGLPPGALEAAYERARQRLALASAADPSAA